MTRTVFSILSLAVLLTATPSAAHAQETAVRFSVTQVSDTSFAFRIGEHVWVRPGMRGIVVDPRQQDVLVARFEITSVANGQANAVITGQTTSVSTSHSVLLEIPSKPWYRQRPFWIGAAIGTVVGFLIGGL